MKNYCKILSIGFSLVLTSLFVNAQTPNWLWTNSAGGIDADYGNNVATDLSGNVYVVGSFKSPLAFFGSSIILTNAGDNDIFLVKYDSFGNILWAKSIGGIGYEYSASLKVDNAGNCYVTGCFASPVISIDTYTVSNSGSTNSFLVKYNPNGSVLWAKKIGGTGYTIVNSVAVDNSGNCLVTGNFQSAAIAIGTYTLASNGSEDVFILKYDSAGNALWAKSAGGTQYDAPSSLSVDANGNISIVGRFSSSSIAFGSHILNKSNLYNCFLVKYDSSGNALWAKRTITSSNYFDEVNSMGVDKKGNIYISGTMESSSLSIGSATLTNAGFVNIFVAKYDSSGNFIWAKSAGGNIADLSFSMATDTSGNSYVCGFLNSATATFGSKTVTNPSIKDIFVAKYDSLGSVNWVQQGGGSDTIQAMGVAIDPSGNIFVTGFFDTSPANIGQFSQVSIGAEDMFVAKLGNGFAGINTKEFQNNITVFPNPSLGQISIRCKSQQENVKLEVFNSLGEIVCNKQLSSFLTHTIDLSNEANGIYFVNIKSNVNTISQKIILQKY